MAILPKILFSTYGSYLLHRFNTACKSPERAQQHLLNHFLEKNSQTTFGKDHRFSEVFDLSDYQKNVPLTTYEDLEPYIQAAMRGNPAQLTIEKPVMYGVTSGTTGNSKYIPVTPESRELKSRLMKVWLAKLFKDYPGIFDGRILVVVSPDDESHSDDGTPCGAESGHGYKNIPTVIKKEYVVPYEVYEAKDYYTKYFLLLRLAAEQQVSFLYTCNPSTVLLLGDLLGEYTADIIKDVRDGVVCSNCDLQEHITDELRLLLEAQCRPNPERAAELEQAADKREGSLYPRDIWPSLAAIGCWKGGTVGMYLNKLEEYYSADVPIRDIGYFATELRGSVPLSDEGADGVLAIETNFYEFADAEDEDPDPESQLTVMQLQEGKRYIPYITTASGLYRYNMNDIIEVSGFYHNTPIIRFIHKAKGFVSFTGEKLSEPQVLQSVDYAFSDYPDDYHFIAAVGTADEDRPYYTFLVELKDDPGEKRLKTLLQRLETNLRESNEEYASKRDSLRLAAPRLRAVPKGQFRAFQRNEVGRGRNDSQFKILRLTDDQSFTDHFDVSSEVTLEESDQRAVA